MHNNSLQELLASSVARFPSKIAVEGPESQSVTYQTLGLLADNLRDQLINLEVVPGDRVGIYLHKSIAAVASIFGILKAGAAYVPLDPVAPVQRNAFILMDCSVKIVIVEEEFEEQLLDELHSYREIPIIITIGGAGNGNGLSINRRHLQSKVSNANTNDHKSNLDDLAYILYTSGSTGKPKGVMLSHRNALSFINWCTGIFEPKQSDRYSSHAPFHFDLSILDIYVPLKKGATLVLVSDDVGKDPLRLAKFISEKKITSWYSTPSVLGILAQYGKMSQYDYSHLKYILFAGEVFPVKHLRSLKTLLPNPSYFNLYGPTETNVCTYFRIPSNIPVGLSKPFPIGIACSHYQIKLLSSDGLEVSSGSEGELCASGPGVMQGYWNRPNQTAATFIRDNKGTKWYKTGDVAQEVNGNYVFLGRRDRMVKKRGYRIELGEIEVALYNHPQIEEVAVIALPDEDSGIQIKVFVICGAKEKPSIIALKKYCTENLPGYMVPDLFSFQEELPKTSTDKTDYQKLNLLA